MILSALDVENPIGLRTAAADILAKAILSEAQLEELCETIKTVGPLELDRVLGALAQSTSETAGLKLLAALPEATSLTSLRIDSLRQRLSKYSPEVIQGIHKVESLVNVDAATQRARIEELLTHVKSGDVRRGQVVFNSTKAACLVCHKFGYGGGMTGPDLTRIGGIRRGARFLLESILYPSLSFVRSYEPVIIYTLDGKVVNGLIRNETADEMILATGPNKEERVRKADIDEKRSRAPCRSCPRDWTKQLSQQDLLDTCRLPQKRQVTLASSQVRRFLELLLRRANRLRFRRRRVDWDVAEAVERPPRAARFRSHVGTSRRRGASAAPLAMPGWTS